MNLGIFWTYPFSTSTPLNSLSLVLDQVSGQQVSKLSQHLPLEPQCKDCHIEPEVNQCKRTDYE